MTDLPAPIAPAFPLKTSALSDPTVLSPIACRLAWASDLHIHREMDVEAIGAAWAREHPADLLVITGDLGTAVGLAELLADLRRGWGKRFAFILGNHDRWFAGFAVVDDLIRRVCAETPGLIWLTEAAPIELSPRCALVGIDGFYDGGWGDARAPGRYMNDWHLIAEFNGVHRHRRAEMLEERGHANAAAGEKILRAALARYDEVLFATHVPPWRDAVMGDPPAFPWYVARYMGEMLERVAGEHPEKKIRVLAGHVHEPRDFDIAPNLSCSTASGGRPAIYTCIDIPR